jgi:drug/metabolite transporter (DMT)-like permease
MAAAVRSISIAQGADPREHALIGFGGAAGQHICEIAELLGIQHVIDPPDAGLLSALLGVLLIISKGDISTLKQLSFNIGDLGVLACAVGWAIYSLSLRRPALMNLPSQVVFVGTMLGGLLCLLPFVMWEEWQAYALPTTAAGWWSVAGLSLIPSVLAFMAFQTGIRKVGAARTAIFLYLMPFYAVLMSMLLLGEATAWYHWVGFACVLLGIALASGVSKSNGNA